MKWSAEIAMLDMWRGMDKNVSNGVMQRYFKAHLQAAYTRGREDMRQEQWEAEMKWQSTHVEIEDREPKSIGDDHS